MSAAGTLNLEQQLHRGITILTLSLVHFQETRAYTYTHAHTHIYINMYTYIHMRTWQEKKA